MLHTLPLFVARGKNSPLGKKIVSILCAFFWVSVLVGDVFADDAYKDIEPDTVRLDTVKVTANKMEEDIKDVPQSITVFDEVELEERGIQNIEDVVEAIPGMFISTNMGMDINFRGLNPSMLTDNNPVVIYIDGIPYSTKMGFDLALVNVQRVEVLRGPQAALYGRDALGAVINVITKDPTNEWTGKVGAEYGNMNKVLGQFAINGPILDDKLFVGFTGQYTQNDGWIKNDYPGMNENADRERDMWFNGQVFYTPTERLRIRLSLIHSFDKYHSRDEYGISGRTDLDEFDRGDAEHIRFDVPSWYQVETNGQSLAASYEFDGFTLHSLTTHNNLQNNLQFDRDQCDAARYLGAKGFEDSSTDTWGQELRVASNNSKGFRWTGGLYYDYSIWKQGPTGVAGPFYSQGQLVGTFVSDSESTQHASTYAAFAQTTIPLWSDVFELTLGGRYQRVRKDIDLSSYMNFGGPQGAPMYSFEAEKTWDAFLPKAALTYIIDDNWTTYVSYSKGYMPGGFNSWAGSGDEDDNSFEPEFSTNYEWGLKASYNTIRMALAVFYMDIDDIHIVKNVDDMAVTSNGEKAHSTGAELEVKYFPIDSLELSTAMSVIEAKYDEFDTGTKNRSGEDIESTPSYSLRFGVGYTDPSGLYGRADVRHIGSVKYVQDYDKADPYTVVDMKVGYRFSDWDIYAFAKNLADEEYINAIKVSSMATRVGYGEPRTFGLGVRYTF